MAALKTAGLLWHSGRIATGLVGRSFSRHPLALSTPRVWRALAVPFASSATWTVAVTARYLLWDYGGEEALRRTRLSEVGSRVRWIGLIPDEDLPAFYNAAACFVYPSLFEGFGLPVLKAMACGTPVVTSDRAALAQLVGDATVVVDPESVEALAEAMTRVLTDATLAADLGRRGLERSRRFSWRETARGVLEVYREAVGR